MGRPRKNPIEGESAVDNAKADILMSAAAKKNAALAELELAEAQAAAVLGDEIQGPEIPENQPSRLDMILQELNGDGSFVVDFVNENGRSARVGQYEISDWPHRMDSLAYTKGGGTFKITFRDSQGRYKGSTTRTFDTDTYGQKKSPAGASDNSVQLFQMLQQMQAQHAEQMNQMRLESQRMMIEMLKMGNQKSSIASSAQDIAVLAKVLNGGEEKKKSAMGEMRELLETIRFLRDDAGMEPENPWVMALNRALGIARPFLEAGARRLAGVDVAAQGIAPLQTQAPTTSNPRSPVPLPAPAAVQQPTAPVSSTPQEAQAVPDGVLLQYAALLKGAHSSGANAESIADLMLSNIQDPKEAELLLMVVNAKDLKARLYALDPAMSKLDSWLSAFLDVVRDEIPEVIEALNTPEPEPDDVTVGLSQPADEVPLEANS